MVAEINKFLNKNPETPKPYNQQAQTAQHVLKQAGRGTA